MKRMILLIVAALMLWSFPVFAQETASHDLAFDGVGFSFDEALGTSVNIQHVMGEDPALEQPGGPAAPHVQMVIYNGEFTQDTPYWGSTVVRVFDVAALSAYEIHAAQVTNLQNLLDTRTDLAAWTTPDIETARELPYLPNLGAGQGIVARAEYVDTDAVRGIRYMTVFRQDVSPFLSNEFHYTFQGLTLDGSRYVAVSSSVSSPDFPEQYPEDFDYETFSSAEGYSAYLNSTFETLNNASGDAFMPALSHVDNLVQSLSIGVSTAPVDPVVPADPDETTDPNATEEPAGEVHEGLGRGVWVLAWYGNPEEPTAALEESPVTLSFTPEGANGRACNMYNSPFEYANDTLTFGLVVSTMMACEEAIMEQEFAYLQALEAVTNFEITAEDQLRLTYPEGVLVFNRTMPE